MDALGVSASFEDNGYLTHESVEQLRRAQMAVKAVSAYEFALPINGLQQWHLGFLRDAEHGDWVLYDSLAQKAPILTSNESTPYTVTYVDLTESAYYMEIPAGHIAGLVLDLYQRPQADLGVLGPDEGGGGRYLLVGPGASLPEDHAADFVIQSSCNLVFIGTRIIGGDHASVEALRRQHYVYQVGGSRDDQKWIAASEDPDWSGEPSRGLDFWRDVFDVLANEPVEGMNRVILTQLRDLGITKSGGFNPNEEQRALLAEAAVTGDAIAMVNTFSKESYKSRHWPDRDWRYILNQSRLDLMHPDYYEAKEIASYTYEAITTSKGMVLPTRDQGSKYLGAYIDDDGEWLDGSHTYQITIPPDPPVVDFWSIAVYTNDTRTLILNDQGRAVVSSQQDLLVEPDGTVKVFIGPSAPDGYEANWVQSHPGTGFFVYLRLYGPTEAYYDKSWIMANVQRIA
ncbi:MAG: DUF1214 domain-containing protein [Acidimicrobiia bacterium]